MLNFEQINIIKKVGYDINTIYQQDKTLIIDYVLFMVSTKNFDKEFILMLKKLLDIGCDLKKGNLLKNISGFDYKDNKRQTLVRFFIEQKFIETDNILLYDDKMLYDTRVGKCIIQIIGGHPNI